ncbi:hypothetical protein [Chitinophaga rhizosphaerae]|uniref:hypothetical protein n=1 Tax=Chitinophaga rhizosphaerae TaxID=1864947 RepID=UPI000F7FE066|nr:hypothetical protein [Chitinophaga rhizosphaerae]
MEPITQIPAGAPPMKGQDFNLLRGEGLKVLQAAAGASWTNHNLSDPGITLLEACCYALTEVGLKAGIPMRDLLVSDAGGKEQESPTPGVVLPMAPLTINDFRKTLIDHPLVRNAWVFPVDATLGGLLKVLLEFEDKQLNTNTFNVQLNVDVSTPPDPPQIVNVSIDVALPFWDEAAVRPFSTDIQLQTVTFQDLGGGANWALIENSTSYLARINVNYQPPAASVTELVIVVQINTPLEDPLQQVPKVLQALQTHISTLGDNSPADQSLLKQYNRWVIAASTAVRTVEVYMRGYRNLCERFATFKPVRLQEVAIAAGIEINAGVAPEELIASILFNIDQHITPVAVIRGISEMGADVPVDELFEGPPLHGGFLPDETLVATNLPERLFSSDILRIILRHRNAGNEDVNVRENVNERRIVSVLSLGMSLYIDNRIVTETARDTLCLANSQQHIPHLSYSKSRITLFRNGIPVPYDWEQVLARVEQLKDDWLNGSLGTGDDLALPAGENFSVKDYYPIQEDLPLVYGVGSAGLPDSATTLRKAQALQLQGYMLFFEQLTAGLTSQLANLNSFFSASPDIDRTIFNQPLPQLPQSQLILGDGYQNALQTAAETPVQFQQRRNRVLNHLLAAFGENMNDTSSFAFHDALQPDEATPLLLGDLLAHQQSQMEKASLQLIREKSAFYYALPVLSRHRAQSFGNPVWMQDSLVDITLSAGQYNWTVLNAAGQPLLRGYTAEEEPTSAHARETAMKAFMQAAAAMSLARYSEGLAPQPGAAPFHLQLREHPDAPPYGRSVAQYPDVPTANADIAAITAAVRGHWQRFALSPLERKLSHLLEIVVQEKRPLLAPFMDYFEVFDEPPPIQKKFRLFSAAVHAGTVLLVSEGVYTGANDPAAVAAAESGIRLALKKGLKLENYRIVPAGNAFNVQLMQSADTVLAVSAAALPTMDAAKARVREIWTMLNRLFSGEGLYLTEHLLLAPGDTPAPELVIPDVKDPYSFQVSVVFPSGYANDFSGGPLQEIMPAKYRDPEFRRFAEKQVRTACPAHILPRIYWVDRELPGAPVGAPGFTRFETAWLAWQNAWLTDETDVVQLQAPRNALVAVLNDITAAAENE